MFAVLLFIKVRWLKNPRDFRTGRRVVAGPVFGFRELGPTVDQCAAGGGTPSSCRLMEFRDLGCDLGFHQAVAITASFKEIHACLGSKVPSEMVSPVINSVAIQSLLPGECV